MTSQPDYYAILRVEPVASQREISRAYRALMRTHHPDVDGLKEAERDADTRDAEKRELLGIMQAFAVLRDPRRRAAYDRNRGEAGREGSAPVVIPVRKVHSRRDPAGSTIRIMPVRWESGPWT